MRHWRGFDTNSINSWSTDDPSCVLYGESLRLADGSSMHAIGVHRAHREGRRIEFLTEGLDGRPCLNPVLGSVLTRARSVRITFGDKRTIALTGSHRLPMDPTQYRGGDTEQWIVRAEQVRPGMRLQDGIVSRVEDLGIRDAVRLWTAHPAWIRTAQHLQIGTRWHEILHAWAVTRGEHEDVEVVAIHGWLWSSGDRDPAGRPDLDRATTETIAKNDRGGQNWRTPALYGSLSNIYYHLDRSSVFQMTEVGWSGDRGIPGDWQVKSAIVAREALRLVSPGNGRVVRALHEGAAVAA